jgi:hypothetical protein
MPLQGCCIFLCRVMQFHNAAFYFILLRGFLIIPDAMFAQQPFLAITNSGLDS